MSKDIISQWIDLPSVKFAGALCWLGITEVYLKHDLSKLQCSGCGQKNLPAHSYYREQRYRDLPVFARAVYLVIDKYLVDCPNCGRKVEQFDFADTYSRYTKRFEAEVAKLCRSMNLKEAAKHFSLNWKTVKDIDKKYLEIEFAIPKYDDLELISIDEVASHKGHTYFTIVLNLIENGVIWGGKGRKKETLDKFFRDIGPDRAKGILACAVDMHDPYLASIREHAPQAKIVFDKFHVIKSYSKIIDSVRNSEYKRATEEDKQVIKGTKYLLLKNECNLKADEKSQLAELLKLNRRLNKVYILKDDLKRLWGYHSRSWANKHLNNWIRQARYSRIKALKRFARTLDGHREGLLNHCEYHINSAKLEGTNNKIKVIKRMAYGFHDDDYFILKIKQACSK